MESHDPAPWGAYPPLEKRTECRTKASHARGMREDGRDAEHARQKEASSLIASGKQASRPAGMQA